MHTQEFNTTLSVYWQVKCEVYLKMEAIVRNQLCNEKQKVGGGSKEIKVLASIIVKNEWLHYIKKKDNTFSTVLN